MHRAVFSATALQYERFRNWKDGKFTVGTPFGTKKSIEEYDLQEQPAILTRAALEQTIGDPLYYPGIETYWIVKLPATFDTCVKGLHPPFRVNHDKSDFSLRNTHWWPFARPDEVVALPWHRRLREDKESAMADLTELPRRNWTEGLRDTPEDVSSAFFPGSTDMVRAWTKLGFVAKFDIKPLPVWLEVERELRRPRLASEN
ncbi:hypothetical protein GSI_15161 [Ganoderma sinense ZZ0214-1]|uniref:L-lysine epsilon oxidase C-terminal domain-containing protein n=1 Tax=Ganoderma sinense ZZ0214-1 TaxID=1077348 RepID=A0A2G8RLT8_9APHY|nr:hypothetical protein GSI_15161 [Ganoderma sinense ZZ0214-1]